MTLPAPFLPPYVDLKEFPKMPLHVGMLRDSKLAARASGDEFRAAVLLWCASWHQVPAASLPDDDFELSALCGYGRAVHEFLKVKDVALSKFTKCSDGRFYHSVIAGIAAESWNTKAKRRWERECDRIRKKNRQAGGSPEDHEPLPPEPDKISARIPPETECPSAGIPAENALKGIEGNKKKKEGSVVLRTTGADAVLPGIEIPPKPPADDPAALLFADGLAILRTMTGIEDRPGRALLGRLRKAAGNDDGRLLAIIRDAQAQGVADAVSWIQAAIRARGTSSPSSAAQAADPWGFGAWLKRQPDVKPDRESGKPTINGYLAADLAEAIAGMMAADAGSRLNWDAFGGWLREDVPITDGTLQAIRRAAAGMRDRGSPAFSLAAFDQVVRTSAP